MLELSLPCSFRVSTLSWFSLYRAERHTAGLDHSFVSLYVYLYRSLGNLFRPTPCPTHVLLAAAAAGQVCQVDRACCAGWFGVRGLGMRELHAEGMFLISCERKTRRNPMPSSIARSESKQKGRVEAVWRSCYCCRWS